MSNKNIKLDTQIERLQFLIDKHTLGIAADFARAIEISPPTFHHYLKGRTPSSDALLGMRRAFGVNINWFLTGEGKDDGDQPSENLKIDTEILHRIINWLESTLDAENKELVPDKKARFIALAYEYFTMPEEGEAGMDNKGLKQLFKLVV